MRVGLAFTLSLAVLTACARSGESIAPSSGEARLTPGTYRRTIVDAGRRRSYLVHLPPQAATSDAMPVVLNFHGGGGNAEGQRRYTDMDSFADEAGFIAVYPDGTGRFPGFLLTWNAGTCCGYARDHKIDDVAFTRALLADLAGVAPVDRRRVYATGLSNGAMMAYRLAAEAPDVVAAIAPVAGAMALDPLRASAPVPVMHIHSIDDPRALYGGGLGPPFPLTTQRVLHNPVETVIAFWADKNGCGRVPTGTDRRVSRPEAGGPEHTATRLDFGPCSSGADVVLWKLTGAGHVWPGGQRDTLRRLLGPGTDVIDANREMWEFFRRYALPPDG